LEDIKEEPTFGIANLSKNPKGQTKTDVNLPTSPYLLGDEERDHHQVSTRWFGHPSVDPDLEKP